MAQQNATMKRERVQHHPRGPDHHRAPNKEGHPVPNSPHRAIEGHSVTPARGRTASTVTPCKVGPRPAIAPTMVISPGDSGHLKLNGNHCSR